MRQNLEKDFQIFVLSNDQFNLRVNFHVDLTDIEHWTDI